MDHSRGTGITLKSTCKVIWDLYIPFNMIRYPFYCLTSRGSHAHHPPYPNRMPAEIRAEFEEIIKNTDALNLTTCKPSIC